MDSVIISLQVKKKNKQTTECGESDEEVRWVQRVDQSRAKFQTFQFSNYAEYFINCPLSFPDIYFQY